MTPVLAAVAGALVAGGVVLVVAGLFRRPVPSGTAPPRRGVRSSAGSGRAGRSGRSGRRSRVRIGRRTAVLAGSGLAVGLLVAITTGWLIAVALVPLAVAGLPLLLAPPSTAHIARLEAMEEWTRSLAGVLTVGVGLEQALVVSLRAAPRPIQREVATLVSRLHARWPTEDAVRAFADDLDDATGDLIAAKLILASHRRGPGLASVLESLAETVAADVRAQRQVEADRDKPRATVRWVTVITVVSLVVLGLNTAYVEPYRSPLGQLLLAILLAVDVMCLIGMRLMTRSTPRPRFIGRGLPPDGVDAGASPA